MFVFAHYPACQNFPHFILDLLYWEALGLESERLKGALRIKAEIKKKIIAEIKAQEEAAREKAAREQATREKAAIEVLLAMDNPASFFEQH